MDCRMEPAKAFSLPIAVLAALAAFPYSAHAETLPPAWVAFARTWNDIAGYSATVTVFEQKGAQVQNLIVDYTFRKPSSAVVHFEQGPNAGVTLVWNGGTTLTAHRGSGFLALFTRTLPLHDSLVTTIRGASIDQLSFAAILTHAQQTPGAVSQGPGPIINGVPTDAVTLIPTGVVRDTGLTLEVVDISTVTKLPLRVLGYEGSKLVRTIEFLDVRVLP